MDVALHPHAVGERVHAVERLEKGGLAGIGGADDAENLVFPHLQRYPAECRNTTIADRDIPHRNLDRGHGTGCRRRGGSLYAYHFFFPRK